MKTLCSRICCLLLFCTLLSLLASAQAGDPTCWSYTLWYTGDPKGDGWVYVGPGQGPYSAWFWAPNGNCPPLSWCPKCNKWIATAGQPINLTSGNTYIEQTDVRVPGLGGGLSLSRTWNSMWPANQTGSQVGIFGSNWRSTYEERVFLDSSGYMAYSKSDGAYWFFKGSGTTWTLAAPANIVATLTSGQNYWTLKFQGGEQRLFSNTSGSLIAIIDRNGNSTQLTYNAQNQLTTVADPALRHLYFTYTSDRVTSVTSDVGLSLSYAYDGQDRLITVTKPDQTTVSFEYDSNSLISAVKDSDGNILESHTYDTLGRGLTSSRAGGVDAVTVSYPTQ